MTNVGVFFGGRSVGHEVSVITAQQTMAAFPLERYTPVPVYIAKDGAWYTGERLRDLDAFRDVERLLSTMTRVTMHPEPQSQGALLETGPRRGFLGGGAREAARIEVAMPLVHGSHGEDGTLQGLFELADIAYCGCDVSASAVSMDKLLAKAAFRAAGLTVLDDVVVDRARWVADAASVLTDVEQHLGYPMYVKPVSLGSSIGVSRAQSGEELRAAVDLALTYDQRCVFEPAQEDIVEINCAVLGSGDDLRVSACEQPKTTGLLSYDDKYLSKGAKGAGGKEASNRVIPAPLPDAVTTRVQDDAVRAFRAIGAEGVARVDFMVRPHQGEVIVNEINTIPGSLSFYLWEPVGVGFAELVTRLIDIALERKAAKVRTAYSIDTWLLSGRRPG
ncbi:MAG: D-alanine--D-alanine ligase [Candidatus Dormibacteraeota bacterium]|nr:D-alanine--D-alanine ligase [Candidatus Dormibacteraeota bacterium]